MARDLARPIKFVFGGPRHGPARSYVQKMGRVAASCFWSTNSYPRGTHTQYTQKFAAPMADSDGFRPDWWTTNFCCCDARSSNSSGSNNSSTDGSGTTALIVSSGAYAVVTVLCWVDDFFASHFGTYKDYSIPAEFGEIPKFRKKRNVTRVV